MPKKPHQPKKAPLYRRPPPLVAPKSRSERDEGGSSSNPLAGLILAEDAPPSLNPQPTTLNLVYSAPGLWLYQSGSQRTRVVTEAWGEQNLYCPNCSSSKLNRLSNNTKASDFSCPKCEFRYQLKGQKTPIRSSITDGAYEAMMEAIREDRAPNFYFMQYELATWSIQNLLLIPHFAFPPSAIIKRKPLSATARRAGWVGCNFALDRIPLDARIRVVTDGTITSPEGVRRQFKHIKPLAALPVNLRGWTLDVLNLVRRVVECRRRGNEALTKKSKPEINQRLLTSSPTPFTNEDIYAFERELAALHPGNRHIRDKIRQQLQVLRDAGLLQHTARGRWILP